MSVSQYEDITRILTIWNTDWYKLSTAHPDFEAIDEEVPQALREKIGEKMQEKLSDEVNNMPDEIDGFGIPQGVLLEKGKLELQQDPEKNYRNYLQEVEQEEENLEKEKIEKYERMAKRRQGKMKKGKKKQRKS